MFHVCPEANGTGKIFPHSFILPDTFFTFINKRNQAIGFNLVFSIQTEHLFNFQFYRKSVGIPSGLSRNLVSFHCTVTRNHIFDYTGQYMTDVGFAVGCRRSVIKGIFRRFFPGINTLFENILFFPEFLNVFFSFHKIHIRRNFVVHNNSSILLS